MRRARVCILHTGGTIGMLRTSQGLAPDPEFLERYLIRMPEREVLPEVDLVTLDPLLDSSDMAPADWGRIANEIRKRASRYRGFVVVHGTDTMAYTASALSFLLGEIKVPVILTGAQLSLTDVRSDGREHLVTSVLLAASSDTPTEVCVYFGARLLRGNRAQKVHNHDFVAFDSGNLPSLATVGATIAWNREVLATPIPPRKGIRLLREPRVAAMRVFPGIQSTLVKAITKRPLEGLVLESYGAGNVPRRGSGFLAAIEAAVARGVVVVNCSQCHGGRVRQRLYSTGAPLEKMGVISGHDMTPEAALTKLYCLLASGLGPTAVRRLMRTNLAGELSFA